MIKDYDENQNCVECREMNTKGGHRIDPIPFPEPSQDVRDWLDEWKNHIPKKGDLCPYCNKHHI